MTTTPGTAVATVPPEFEHEQQAVTLFGTNDPKEISNRVVALAGFVEDIVSKGKLTTNIQGRKFVNVEGWQAAGVGLGLSPYIVSCVPTGPLDDNFNSPGFVAVGELRNRDGMVISRAEASCERDESAWATRNNYALRSMAQTRVTGKLFRQVLGFVMTVAGYAGTPAEEVSEGEGQGGARRAQQPRGQAVRTGPPAAGAPARQAQAARSAAEGAPATPAPAQPAVEPSSAPAQAAEPSQAAPSLDPKDIRTVNQLVRRLDAVYEYDEATLFRILNVDSLDGIRNLGITKTLETVRIYFETVDPRGAGALPAAARNDDDIPFDVEDVQPGNEAVLEGEVMQP